MAVQEQKKYLGSTNIEIGPIGIGTWSWGDQRGWGYGSDYNEGMLYEAFETCVGSGIKFFDTAEVYGEGRSEQLLGGFLQRKKIPLVIATKFSPYRYRLSGLMLNGALRRSLRRLQLPQVALYQLHWQTRWVSVERWMAAMANAARAGLVRAIGVSNYTRDQMRRAGDALAKRGLSLASNQVEYSLLCRKPEIHGIVDLCRERGTTLIAYSPIGMGLLSGKYSPDHLPAGGQRTKFSRDYVAKIEPIIPILRKIGEQHGGKTPSQVALNWVICKGAFPIPGVKNKEQAREVVGATGWRLEASEIAALDEASGPLQM